MKSDVLEGEAKVWCAMLNEKAKARKILITKDAFIVDLGYRNQ